LERLNITGNWFHVMKECTKSIFKNQFMIPGATSAKPTSILVVVRKCLAGLVHCPSFGRLPDSPGRHGESHRQPAIRIKKNRDAFKEERHIIIAIQKEA
jgi:hypothetical protein